MANSNTFLDYAGLTYYHGKIKTQFDEKVDKVEGMGLSENDYTTAEKTKLQGIQAEATKTTATAVQTTGTKIGTVSVNGTDTDLYVPNDTASASANGLMSSIDKAKLDSFTSASDYALKSDITNMYRYKGSVADETALPKTDNVVGDVYNTEDTGMNYAWTETGEWDPLGSIFALTSITNAEIDSLFTAYLIEASRLAYCSNG